ncbi:MAG TPA: hypothetical protein VMV95_00595, partial [Bacillota bacterium]|nr:hypothetical protein [Bacillota bacterium]
GSPISSSAKAVSSSRTPSSSVSSYPSSIISSYPISSARSYRGYGSSYLRGSSYTRTPPPPSSYKFRPGKPKSIFSTGKYNVLMRRFGKFKIIGSGLTQKQAEVLGIEATGKTLGATYKIEGKPGVMLSGLRVPKRYYKKITPQGILFIQKPKYRLSRATEKKEIQYYKRLKAKPKAFSPTKKRKKKMLWEL